MANLCHNCYSTLPNCKCIVCEFIGGPYDGLLKILHSPKFYEPPSEPIQYDIRAYWLGSHYVSPGLKLDPTDL